MIRCQKLLHCNLRIPCSVNCDDYVPCLNVAEEMGEIPPSPDHVADLLERRLVKEKHINKKYADIMRKLYALSKKITHREIKEISGKEYDKYKKLAETFVDGMKKFIEKKI